ncbi:MAG: VWA domain-containing protein [Spirochaetia bacterium]|jgi:hypothetical protein|nr:VWA domain-containing protein [Spirochaetia bacterium]
MKTLGCIILLVFLVPPVFGEVAVFPYRVENISSDFADDSGGQYSKLLSVALSLATRLDVTSQRDVLADAYRLKLNANSTISADDLMRLGQGKGIDYILTGKIAVSGGRYVSESILFSVKEGRSIQKAKTSAPSLFELAEKDVHEFFSFYEKPMPEYASAALDIAFIIDCSFAVTNEWNSIKQAVTEAGGYFSQRGKTSFRVYLVPFSGNYGFDKASVADSLLSLKNNLAKLKPSGAYTDASFGTAMRYAVKSILWRKNASRRIVIITNSRISSSGFPEQYGMLAKRAGLAIDSVLLGKLAYESAGVPLSLGSASGGLGRYVSYHQRAAAPDGKSRDVFFERGRIFYSASGFSAWRGGLLKQNGYQSALASALPGLDEIYADKRAGDPYSLVSAYSSLSGERVIDKGPLENNIARLVMDSAALCRDETTSAPVGGITVSDGSASIMADVFSEADMRFFESKSKSGEFFSLGVSVADDKDSPYGIRPAAVSRNLHLEDVPSVLRVSIKDLVQKKEHYGNGLLKPPVWFIRVQVQGVRSYSEKTDIRDE